MPDLSRDEVLKRYGEGERGFERIDLRDIKLDHVNLEKINFRRADLHGANLEECILKNANLSNADLREVYLARANLEGANMQRVDLEGAILESINLEGVDLSRSNLEGALFEKAHMEQARLMYAQLEQTNFGGALMEGVVLSNADLRDTYLGGTKLSRSDFSAAQLDKVNFEDAELIDANFREAVLKRCNGEGANFSRAILQGATLEDVSFARADLSGADLRYCDLRTAKLTSTKMTGAKLFGIEATPEQLAEMEAEWVDFSADGDGRVRLSRDQLVEHYRSSNGAPAGLSAPRDAAPRRVFGKGDVMKNAVLEFGALSVVEVEGRFEKCSVALGDGAHFLLGPEGVMEECLISGSGEIVIQGTFSETSGGAGIIGPKRFIVSETGSVTATVEQPASLTQFAFERGCHLRMKITTAR